MTTTTVEPITPPAEAIRRVQNLMSWDPSEVARDAGWVASGNVLVGMVEKYDWPWWTGYWSPDKCESPFYADTIPVGVVQRRLMDWDPVELGIADSTFEVVDGEVFTFDDHRTVEGFKSIRRSDNGELLHVARKTLKLHHYRQWLLENFSAIIGDTLRISSAGLLQRGAVAWVQVESDDLQHRSGIQLRPHLMFTTSYNESYASTCKHSSINTVCGNTHRRAMGEPSATYRVRHTSRSEFDVTEARRALGLLEHEAQEWEFVLDELTNISVTPQQWGAFLEREVPTVDDGGKALSGRSKTMADRKRDELATMWRRDPRVSPWAGSAWGVVQAVNTWATHSATVRNVSRAERQLANRVDSVSPDAATLSKLDIVLSGGIKAAQERIAKREQAAKETRRALLAVNGS